MGMFTMLSLIVITGVFAFTFLGISLSYPALNRTGTTSVMKEGWIDPNLDSQQMEFHSSLKYILPNELLKFESRDPAGKALKWGCTFLYRPCSFWNALNPFIDTDCCLGNCLLTWTSRSIFFISWKCIPPYKAEYADFPSD
ncbi:unnamed protein product [Allacma fusca]|uniref:Uncharacterized protein n=1 Tax=Allacma fusca TaxID=39272 RepID=A0A8J2KG46_9HEXA|nr:unnamed protein product [Allacma fusca]